MRTTLHFLLAIFVLVGMIGCGGGEDPAPPATPTAPAAPGTETPAAPGTETPATPGTETPAGGATAAPAAGETAANGLDVSLVRPDHFTAVIVHPSRVVKSPMLAPFITDDVKAQFQATIDPAIVERVLVLLTPPKEQAGMGELPVSPTVMVNFTQPVDLGALLKKLGETGGPPVVEKALSNGKTGYVLDDPPAVAFMQDDKTLMITEEAELPKLGAAAGASPLKDKLGQLDLNADVVILSVLEPVQASVGQATEMGKEGLPEGLEDLATIPEKLDAVAVAVNIDGTGNILNVTLEGKDEASGKEISDILIGALQAGKILYGAAKGQMEPAEQAEMADFIAFADKIVGGIAVNHAGANVTVGLATPEGLVEAIPGLVAKGQEMAGSMMGPPGGMPPGGMPPGGMPPGGMPPGMEPGTDPLVPEGTEPIPGAGAVDPLGGPATDPLGGPAVDPLGGPAVDPAAAPKAPSTEIRTWTDSTGAHKIEASFVSFDGTTVQLKKADGSPVALPLNRLSTPDQQWVQENAGQ